ncbi:MAG: hypothetical protein IJ106_07585 [Parasporobacterium sp.]|nr:hypothetical protein [Parasporobacterium sp.]
MYIAMPFLMTKNIIPDFRSFCGKIHLGHPQSRPSADMWKVGYGVYMLFLRLPSGFLMFCPENGRQHMEFIGFFRIYLPNDISLHRQIIVLENYM